MRLGVYAHIGKAASLKIARGVISYIVEVMKRDEGVNLILEKKTADRLGIDSCPALPLPEMEMDCLICIGGDGTVLRAFNATRAPVLGINAGGLGFLMEVDGEKALNAVERLIIGDYTIEERSRLMTHLNGIRLPDATNEAVLITSNPSKIQTFEITIDEEYVQRIRADGIIITTPTGSTGYALSAGGSILDPRVEAIEIAPIAPFRMNSRPLIIPNNLSIKTTLISKKRTAKLVIDGAHTEGVKRGDEVIMTSSKERNRFVKLDLGFYRQYQEKIVNEGPDRT